MKVYMKCFATLVKPESCNFDESTIIEIEAGQTVEDLIEVAGIEKENVKLAFVNNKIVDLRSALSDGDRVGLAPATGGM